MRLFAWFGINRTGTLVLAAVQSQKPHNTCIFMEMNSSCDSNLFPNSKTNNNRWEPYLMSKMDEKLIRRIFQ